MNIAVLIGRFPPGVYGGAELQAQGWARRLSKKHSVVVVTRKNHSRDPAREQRGGYAVARVPVVNVPVLRSAMDLARIERELRDMRPRAEILLCFQTFLSGLAGVLMQSRLGVPAVVWIRGEDEYRLSGIRTRLVAVPVWRKAAAVLVQNESTRIAVLHTLARLAPGAIPEFERKLEVVPNGLDLPESVAPPGGTVLTVARLIRDKGVDVVIEAMKGIGKTLVVAGSGPQRESLEAQARDLGIDARFEGFAPRERLDALYLEAACVVLGSRRGEGMPNVLLEGFGHGRGAVATAIPGVSDIVEHGVNGLVVPPSNPGAMRAALLRVFQERGLAERLGVRARATAERHDWERVYPLLESVLERRRGR
jgi:glycosyltransferase involved in cell wall biosynthesis